MKQFAIILSVLFALQVMGPFPKYHYEVLKKKGDYETRAITFLCNELKFRNEKFPGDLDSLLSTYISDSLWKDLAKRKDFHVFTHVTTKSMNDSSRFCLYTSSKKNRGYFDLYGGYFKLHGCTFFVNKKNDVKIFNMKPTGNRIWIVDTLNFYGEFLIIPDEDDNYMLDIVYEDGHLTLKNPEDLEPHLR